MEGRAAKLGVVFVLVISSSSSSSKYDPEILKAEIATTKSRVSGMNGPQIFTSSFSYFQTSWQILKGDAKAVERANTAVLNLGDNLS